MNTYFTTFGQSHPLKDHYIRHTAWNAQDVRDCMFRWFGPHWAMLYSEAEFTPELFPDGEIHLKDAVRRIEDHNH